MIVVLAFCSGTVLSFDQPTRSSLRYLEIREGSDKLEEKF
jgi:hypothetical protein